MRLDTYLFEIGKYPSRNKAQEAIEKGEVLYNNKIVKPSKEVENESLISYSNVFSTFVSNGGYKLDKALTDFNLDIKGLSFADIGASNGGFTDCLLKRQASKVFAIDVGESQLDKSLLIPSVIVLDNTNARYLTKEKLGTLVDGVTCDVSFISLTYVLPSIKNILKDNGIALLLIKPQFECGKEYLGKSGIVNSILAKIKACKNIYNEAIKLGLTPINFTVAPIKPKKNIEYVIMLKNNSDKVMSFLDIENIIRGM